VNAVAALNRPFSILREYSAFLIAGSVAAIAWANLDLTSYQTFLHRVWGHPMLFGREIGHHGFTFHFAVNDIFMAFFFGIATKEVVEAFLPGGPLSSPKKASLPMISTIGGVAGPVLVFVAACLAAAPYLLRGWAVPTATDIAYSWLFAGLIFGYKHPATKFLLALAVLDDLIGMVIIAIFYSSTIQMEWMTLVAAGMMFCGVLRWWVGVKSFWPYLLIGGTLSWFGLLFTGVHAALALVPIIPLMPSEKRDVGLFEEEDMPEEASPGHAAHPTDALNSFEHTFKPYVDVGLLTFGLVNAGVPFSAFGLETWITLAAIFIGKTIGIFLFTVVGRLARLSLPAGMTMRECFVMGNVAAIGFTVALFVTDVAFPKAAGADAHAEGAGHAAEVHDAPAHRAPGPSTHQEPVVPPPPPGASYEDLSVAQKSLVKDKVKMGALLSFLAGATSMLLGRLLGVRKISTDAELRERIRELSAA
jgi:NhaA family Na+:H+ antiporter